MKSCPNVRPGESASCGLEKSLPSCCASCGSAVALRTLYCGSSDKLFDLSETAHGSLPFRLSREGRALCLHCAWIDASPVQAVRSVLDEEDWTTREVIVEEGLSREPVPLSYEDIMAAWKEQEHIYIPPGSNGGSSGAGRFKRKKTGTKIAQEDWTGWA